jgi:hypothetical protein
MERVAPTVTDFSVLDCGVSANKNDEQQHDSTNKATIRIKTVTLWEDGQHHN